ncbi:NADH-ubiquinone oxidoreductase-F iron-sulfur binding region domain-containing protein [Georgenia muralis]
MTTTVSATSPTTASATSRATTHDAGLLLGPVRLPRASAGAWAGPPEGLAAHVRRLGPRPAGGAWLLATIDAAGLTGHGGAHVPTASRWRAAMDNDEPAVRRRPTADATPRRPLTAVANAAESEPLSAKDATLLRQRPHLVLDGLDLMAETLRADRAVLWLHDDDRLTRAAVELALRERPVGRVPVEVAAAPAHYLSGERSAIARALAGGPVLPLGRPAPEVRARWPCTVVSNAETLARAALLARGLPPLTGRLLTVLTPAGREVVEVPAGTPADVVLAGAGWREAPQAVLLGGFGGIWAPWHVVATFDEAALRPAGLSAGAGIVAPLPYGACGLAETAAITGYLAAMSAGQCGPCVFGLPALADDVRRLAAGTARRTARLGRPDRLTEDLDLVAGRGGCHHPDGAVGLIRSAMSTFADDAHAHSRGRACRVGTFIPVPVVRS